MIAPVFVPSTFTVPVDGLLKLVYGEPIGQAGGDEFPVPVPRLEMNPSLGKHLAIVLDDLSDFWMMLFDFFGDYIF